MYFKFIEVSELVKRNTLYIYIFFSSIAFISFINQKTNPQTSVQANLATLTSQEKEYMTNFFKFSFFSDGLGYVLFYDKPMNMTAINISQKLELPSGEDYMEPIHILNQYKLRECWGTWTKYSDLFALKNFTILTEWTSDVLMIRIINHKNFKKMVSKHLVDFQQVIGTQLTAQKILEECIKGRGRVYDTVMHHDGLLGTLLGYGRDNAWEFMRQGGGKKMDGLGEVLPEGSKEIQGIHFCVISGTKETEFLRVNYEKQRQKLNLLYHSNDFLEQVLTKLTSDE